MIINKTYFFRFFFFLFSVFSSTAFAVIKHVDTKPAPWKDMNSKETVVSPGLPFYAGLSGGYGVFEGALSNDGQIGIFRLTLGTQLNFNQLTLLGVELGIQTGERMRINTENAIEAIGISPIFLTIKPPLDALLTVTFHVGTTPLSIQAKGGVAYLQGMIDSLSIPNKSQLTAEAQLGLRYDFFQDISLVVYYQRLFGNTPELTHIDICDGTATLKHLPTLQAGFIGVEKRF